MLVYLWKEFFTGWKKEKLSRLRALCYQALVFSFQLFIAFSSAKTMKISATGELSTWMVMSIFLLLAVLLIMTVYCSILIMVKRIRDLGFKYCLTITIFTFFANLCAFKLMSIITALANNDHSQHMIQYIIYIMIIIWNLYLITGKSR
ncbi:hypothetical protein LH23_08180 [Cedecea neteri]|uniref:Uncharacterized protein n=1 Tax=Cedecea neteri TaxID=158822 RepID=A0AAN0S3C6_9ENTR|nr:hypothetical protein [Cedecea neteri]AIR60634.1 hypothetical protein LH23_08180 [Cedecea neteri]